MNAAFDRTHKSFRFAAAAAMTGLAAMSLLMARPAAADPTAVAFLKPYVTWATTKPQGAGIYGLSVTMVSNNSAQWATYAESDFLPFENNLVWERSPSGFWILTPVVGFYTSNGGFDATQYFNFNRYSWAQQGPTYPFAPTPYTDVLDIGIAANTGTLTVTVQPGIGWGYWGFNCPMTADLHAANGVLIGTLNDPQGTT